ncbi:MAG: Hpt domain-containing protein, partial [Deltaproteobacteria bacterium]
MEPSSYGYSMDDFMEEARELLARAEGVLSELRESPNDMGRVNALFRVIHSLKGSAAYAGLADVNAFAHLYESFLGDLRHKKYDVNRDVLNILIRATDYLDDLISQPESAEVLKIDESLGGSMRQMSAVLSGRRGGLPWRENIVSLSPPLGKAGQGVETKASQQKNVALPTQHPDRMGQDDIIKITIMNDLKALYSCLKEQAPDKAVVSKLFTKLEDGALWAFGDSAELVRLFGEMEVIVSGDIGANELLQLRKGFNSLAAALKKELGQLDGTVLAEVKIETQSILPVKEGETKASPDEIRGASKDEIVNLTVTRYIGSLAELTSEESLDVSQIR